MIQPNETADAFTARITTFLKNVTSDVLIFAMVGPQLSDDVHKKVYLEIYNLQRVY